MENLSFELRMLVAVTLLIMPFVSYCFLDLYRSEKDWRYIAVAIWIAAVFIAMLIVIWS